MATISSSSYLNLVVPCTTTHTYLGSRQRAIPKSRSRSTRPFLHETSAYSSSSSSSSSSSRTSAPSLISSTHESLYAVLGIDQDASLSGIKSAYRRMALQYHPDVCSTSSSASASDIESCTRKFMAAQEAYEVLSDPARRADYDFCILHPLCAQALHKGTDHFGSGSRAWQSRGRGRKATDMGTSEAGTEASWAWKLQWEAQINMLKQRQRPSSSWGANARARYSS